MNAHEQLDKFLNLSPRAKTFIVLGIILFFLIIISIVFKLGESSARSGLELEKSAKEQGLFN